MKFRPWLALAVLFLALGAGGSASAKELKYCRDGALVDSKSALGRQLHAAPDTEALAVFNKVEDPSICDYTHDGKVDYNVEPRCKPICEKRRGQLGDLLSCIRETADGALNDCSAKYGQFVVNTSGLPIRFMAPSSPAHDIRGLLTTEAGKRSAIKISVNEEDHAVDISKPNWNSDWKALVADAVAVCEAASEKKPARDCTRLTQAGLGFAAKVKLLEKGAALENKLREKTAPELAGVSVCDPGSGNFGLGVPRKPPLTANKKPMNVPPGTGKLDPIFRDCQNGNVSAIEIRCADLTASGLGAFTDEVQKIFNNPGVLVNYIDLLRIRSVDALMKTHREVIGAPLAGLPKGCDRFKAGIAAAETPLNAAEKKNFEDANSAENLSRLQETARKMQGFVRAQREAEAVPKWINCHHNGETRECDYNPAYPAALERLDQMKRLVRKGLERYPVFSARDEQPKNMDDLPAINAIAGATPDTLPKVLADTRRKISNAISKNIGKACNNSNDSGGWGQNSDSVSWIDLVRLPGLTSDTVHTPPFGVFDSMQRCLKRKADDITAGRDEAQVLVAVGCTAGTIMSGPFVGVPCAGVMLGMAGSDLLLASNRVDWIRECQEQQKGTEGKAFCSTDDYLSAREQYESAIEAAVLAGGFAALEGGHGILKLAKYLSKAKLLKYAAQIGAAGGDAKALSGIEKAIGEDALANGTMESPVDLSASSKPRGNPLEPESGQAGKPVNGTEISQQPAVGAPVVADTPTGRPTKPDGLRPNGENPIEIKMPRDRALPKIDAEAPAPRKKLKPNGKKGMDRVEYGFSAEKGAPEVTAPEIELKSPLPGGKPMVEPEVNYSNLGKTREQLVREGAGAAPAAKLKPLGKGGFQSVFENPTNKLRAAKIYDRELIWENTQKQFRRRIAAAIKKRDLGAAMKYKRVIDEMKASIPKGGTVPPEIDRKIAVMIQRQRAYGKVLRETVVPRLNSLMGGEIKVTMVDGLENVSDTGFSDVEKVTLGQIDGAPAGTRWVESDRYAAKLKEGSPEWKKFRDVEARWNSSVAPFDKQMAGSGEKLGVVLRKGDQALEFDFGTPGDNMSNTFMKVDAGGNVLEIKISDF
ncbi:MAG: hypothetical protein HY074_13335 [Deltaproteobacteria bacterium]|nr:hypothetical protein [Deltaproteobacteria bacterium]